MEILIVAGEHSGDFIGAAFVRAVHGMSPDLRFVGTGGDRMTREGVECLFTVESMNWTGPIQILRHLPKILFLAKKLLATVRSRQIKHAVLIDYPGFNLFLAKKLRKMGVRCIQYVSPDLWVWNPSRIHLLKHRMDLVFALFRFEKKYLQKRGMRAEWVGHPLVRRARVRQRPQRSHSAIIKTVCLLPGSRSYKSRHSLPQMLAVADKLDKRATEAGKKIRFLIPIINASQSKNISKKIERFQSIHPELRIVVRKEDAWRSIGESDLALLSSGSSSLEAALQHVPMVAFLRIPTWHAWIARRFARVKMICLVNLLARKEIVPEFVQDRYDEDAIAKEALRLLVDRKHIQKQKNQFRRCLPELGTGDPSEKAAKLFLTWVRKKNQRR